MFLIYSFLMLATNVCACDKPSLGPAAAFKEADVVFRGVVENLRYLDDPEKTKTEPRIIVTFKVSKVWKGAVDKTLVIQTTHNKTTCNGYVFKYGEEYLVYSRYNRRSENFFAKLFAPAKPTLGVKVYGGTKPISGAGADLKYLDTGKVE